MRELDERIRDHGAVGCLTGAPAPGTPTSRARRAARERGRPWTCPRQSGPCSRTARSLSALPITETEDRLIAAAATTGDSRRPKTG